MKDLSNRLLEAADTVSLAQSALDKADIAAGTLDQDFFQYREDEHLDTNIAAAIAVCYPRAGVTNCIVLDYLSQTKELLHDAYTMLDSLHQEARESKQRGGQNG